MLNKSEVAEETVYTPDGIRHAGGFLLRNMVKGLWGTRELIWRLICRDIAVRYRQSILGYLWALLPAIATVLLFSFLIGRRVLLIDDTALPYPVYALWSVSVWHLFSGTLSGATASLVNAGSLVTKVNFPKEALVISAIGLPTFDFLVRLIPLAAVFAWYDVVPPWSALLLPFVLVFVVLLALGIGFFLAIANLAIRDIANALSIVLTFAMFAAPIVYPPPTTWPFVMINVLNPFSPLLIATQDVLALGQPTNPTALGAAMIFASLTFLVGWRAFQLTMPRVAERA
jgi:lipopolysaccharide transport system permease protein